MAPQSLPPICCFLQCLLDPLSTTLPHPQLHHHPLSTLRHDNSLPFFFFLAVLGFELRAYTSSHSVMGFFEIGSRKLFAWAGFDGEPPDLCLLSS
jgi:hypothetical protein